MPSGPDTTVVRDTPKCPPASALASGRPSAKNLGRVGAALRGTRDLGPLALSHPNARMPS